MEYQLLAKKRKIKQNEAPYDIIKEFDNLEIIFYLLEEVSESKYNEVIVIDTYTNEIVYNIKLKETKKRTRKKKY